MLTLRPAFLSMLAMSMSLVCVGQFQLARTDPSGNLNTTCVRTTDGGIITTHDEPDGVVLRKMASDGTVLWSRLIDETTPTTSPYSFHRGMCRDASGGAFFALDLRSVFVEHPLSDPDTMRNRVLISHVDASGNIDSRMIVRTTYLIGTDDIPYIGNIWVASADGADPLIAIEYRLGNRAATELIQFNNTLDPVWMRCIGDQGAWSGFPLTEGWLLDHGKAFSFLPDGQLIYGHSFPGNGGHVWVTKLTNTGDFVWSREFRYTNTIIAFDFDDLVVGPNEDVHVLSHMKLLSGPHVMISRVNQDGQHFQSSIYATGAFTYEGRMAFTPDGQRLVHGGGNTMICDTLGSDAPVEQLITIPSGDLNVSCGWSSFDLLNDMYCAAGTLREQHQITSYTNLYQSVVSMNVADLSTCFTVNSSAAHYDVTDIMTQSDLGDMTSVDVSSYYTIMPDTGIVITDVAPPDFTDICSFVIGMEDGSVQMTDPLVRNSIVTAGMPFELNRPIIGRIEVLDVSGRVVYEVVPAGAVASVPSTGWSPGTYLLRATDTNGRLVGAQRVVVQ